jgi:hypothetical protein
MRQPSTKLLPRLVFRGQRRMMWWEQIERDFAPKLKMTATMMSCLPFWEHRHELSSASAVYRTAFAAYSLAEFQRRGSLPRFD